MGAPFAKEMIVGVVIEAGIKFTLSGIFQRVEYNIGDENFGG